MISRNRRHLFVRMIGILGVVGFSLAMSKIAIAVESDCAWPSEMPSPEIVLVGEVHGTQQAPRFVGELACSTLKSGMDVTVALELPLSEQRYIDEFLDSDGGEVARERVISGPFWNQRIKDGRSSAAMLKLIEQLRDMRGSGGRVNVIAVDAAVDGSRDMGMARRIASASVRPNTRVIALLGNGHARKKVGAVWDPNYVPAGLLLSVLSPLSVRFEAGAGAAWFCQQKDGLPTCGVVNQAAREKLEVQGYVEAGDEDPGYDGKFLIEESTASPPAVGFREQR